VSCRIRHRLDGRVWGTPNFFRFARNRGAGLPIHDAMMIGLVGFEAFLADVAGALWTGELLIASGIDLDVFPEELDELVGVFRLFRPTAQA
jgi:hypothetical protein